MTVRTAARPCTRDSVRCSDARDYNMELAECCRDHVRMLMEHTAAYLNEIGAVWWADYGTLLGAYRNPMTTWADYPWLPQEGRTTAGPAPGIVPHDKDADLGVMMQSWEFARRRFGSYLTARKLHLRMNVVRHSMKARLSMRNHTNVDVFFWHQRTHDGTLYRNKYAQVDKFKGREFHKSLLFPLSTVEWEGLTLPAPRDPAAFLAMRYGPGWRTPLAANSDGVLR